MATLVLRLGGRDIKTIPIGATQTLIGRDPRCDVFIDNPAISRRHARIECRNGKFTVFDTTSRNGVYIDNEPVSSAPLQDQTVMQIGKFTLVFLDAGGVAPDKLKRFEPKEGDAPAFSDGTTMLDRDYLLRMRSGGPQPDPATEPALHAAAVAPFERSRRQNAQRLKTTAIGLGATVFVLVLALIYVLATR